MVSCLLGKINSDACGDMLDDNIIDNAPVAVFVVDTARRVVRWNKYLEKLSGISRDRVIGQELDAHITEVNFAGLAEAIQSVINSGDAFYALERGFMRTIGEVEDVRYQDVTIVPLRKMNTTSGVLGILSDATERRYARALAHEAEQEATRAREHMARFDRVHALGMLTSTIAHDVMQPLTSLEGYTKAAIHILDSAETSDRGRLRALLEKISAQTHRVTGVVAEARSMMKKRSIHVAPCHIGELIDEVVLLITPKLSETGCALRWNRAESSFYAEVDRLQLQRAVMNIIDNAADALASSDVEIRQIEIVCHGLEGNRFAIRIADNGPGVAQENIENLFSPLHSNKPEGLGVGLAISRSIVEMHHGSIGYRSGPEGGAIFEIVLHENRAEGTG